MHHVCDYLNFIRNSRSNPLAPDKMIEGQGTKINYRTDILTLSSLCRTKLKVTASIQDVGLCLGRCPNTADGGRAAPEFRQWPQCWPLQPIKGRPPLSGHQSLPNPRK